MPDTPETETVVAPLLSDAIVKRLIKAGATFVKGKAGSTLDKLRADIRDTVEAHTVYRPAYDVAAAAWRKREGKAESDAYSFSSFVTTLETRMQVIQGDPDASFPLTVGEVKRIVELTGDQASHDANERAFLAYCSAQEVRVLITSYVKWLGLRGEGKVNDDGSWTDIGQKAIDDDAAESAAVVYRRICGQDFAAMLDGVPRNVRHAWIRAAREDLEFLDNEANAAATADDLKAVRKLVKAAKEKGTVIAYARTEAEVAATV